MENVGLEALLKAVATKNVTHLTVASTFPKELIGWHENVGRRLEFTYGEGEGVAIRLPQQDDDRDTILDRIEIGYDGTFAIWLKGGLLLTSATSDAWLILVRYADELIPPIIERLKFLQSERSAWLKAIDNSQEALAPFRVLAELAPEKGGT